MSQIKIIENNIWNLVWNMSAFLESFREIHESIKILYKVSEFLSIYEELTFFFKYKKIYQALKLNSLCKIIWEYKNLQNSKILNKLLLSNDFSFNTLYNKENFLLLCFKIIIHFTLKSNSKNIMLFGSGGKHC